MHTSLLTRRALGPAVAVLALALSTAAQAATTAPAAQQGAAGQRGATASTPSAANLEAAVGSGRLDGAVVRTLRARGHVEAIVTFADRQLRAGVPRGRQRELLADLRAEYAEVESEAVAAADGEARVLRPFANLPVSFVRFESEDALLATLNADGVTGVRENVRGTAADAQSLPLIGQPTVAAQGKTGAGTYVAVLDTGVEYARAAFGSCAAPGGTCRVALAYEHGAQDGYQDDNGHGTNVAGIVAAVAPGTKIIAMDVFTGNQWTSTAIIAAVDQLVALRAAGWNIRAMNLSIQEGTYYDGACDAHALAASFNKARQWGIQPVVSAGNKALVSGAYRRGISGPACVSGTLAVGATSDSAHSGTTNCDAASTRDQVMYFSQSGGGLSLFAPGNCIDAAGLQMQGTSQAAPHVAAAVAILGAAKPSATMEQIRSALVNTGPWITDSRFGLSRRRLDLPAAATALLGTTGGGVDTIAPAVTAPVQSLPLDWYLGSAAVPVHLRWSASDASGIAQYDVMFSRDGGAWTRLALPNAAANSVTVTDLVPGSSYRFIVAAKDGAGNWSTWAYGPTFTVDAHQETSTAVSYTAGWTRLAWASAFGGFQSAATVRGAQATLTFTGRDVAWVAPVSTLGGRAYVYVDGAYVQTVDLYRASTTARNIVFSRSFGAVGTHSLTVYVEGTAGRPQVDVDAFVVLR